ncbi:PhzF family phenazine biosynthesis protein [Halogranum rubrum]|uniref:Phenazine biosynthesis protein phzf family n=1 Tax=Halogranum salarium B-1 TaxID=1210908 RepID=J3EZ17_9EURY|nr:PhzF family phenazine biosynthesis protein [Halogranum salarium]EJN60712.1 phenazine biosynthesis protein phzf family [Halogranum salarium B-1]
MDTDTRRALLVDAFTTEPLAGNAAGVVPDADGLSETQMQAIARELAVSETVFVHEPDDDGDYRVRYFTPTQEVDLCGHATVALHAHLHADGVLDAGTHAMETNVGTLDVDVGEDGVVWMTQADPTVEEVTPDEERVADALGVDVATLRDVGADLPMAVASTGLRFLIVPINFLEHLGNADPDMDAIEALTEEYEVTGLYAFTFDALDADSTLHGRMFAPGAGIPEDPVTGTASGACGAYLREVDAFEDSETQRVSDEASEERSDSRALPDEMRFEQGHFVDRPGLVRVRIGDTVQVGGRATPSFDGTMLVPEDEDDDIIEA